MTATSRTAEQLEKNQQQISSILFYMLVAVVFWDVIVFLILKYAQNGTSREQNTRTRLLRRKSGLAPSPTMPSDAELEILPGE